MKTLWIALTLSLSIGLIAPDPADAQFWKRDKDKKERKEKKEKKDEDRRCEDVDLEWLPSEDYSDLDAVNLTGISDLAIEVGTFSDGRRVEDPRELGRNVEDADDDDPEDRKILYFTSDTDITEYVRSGVGEILHELGYSVVDSGGKVQVSGEIRTFHVEEDSTYEADVRIFFKVTRGGRTVYEGMHGETDRTFGRSYKCENYMEVLADALIEVVHDLAVNDDFYDALAGR